MERKRKLPPRAAARNEHVSKKRSTDSPESSATPARQPSPTPVEPVHEEPELPTSVQTGNPLPTVEKAQPHDLPQSEYQSIQESGVLSESLSRSRQRWVHDIFEKYWSKPSKRKGVVKEEPNNPPKDSMAKIGQINITVEPHVFDVVMYAIKDPKPSASNANSNARPIIQYGPPNGVMPPPPKPNPPSTAPQSPSPAATGAAVPASSPSSSAVTAPTTGPPAASGQMAQSSIQSSTSQSNSTARHVAQPPQPAPAAPSAGLDSVLAAPSQSQAPTTTTSQPPTPMANPVAAHHHAYGPGPTNPAALAPVAPGPGPPAHAQHSATPAPPAQPPQAAPGQDPIIVILAARASDDPVLRDLMKRVAVGNAAGPELTHFQKIIDQITAEHKKTLPQGPSPEKLLVDGRTVKFFADEVASITQIILSSNPKQTSVNLRTPPESDPLVILLVKKSLDDGDLRELVHRISLGKAQFSDANKLQSVLEKLKEQLVKEAAKPASKRPSLSGDSSNAANGGPQKKLSISTPSTPTQGAPVQQALRSKGPPPSIKPNIAGLVLEFPGGTGDRYLFPKYSILEYPSSSEVFASFLVVRRGSKSEYGGDPTLDYYQPVTIRIHSPSGKHLENFAQVVAPQDEVRRYMDDIMNNMTRAEYILLAMRLPRADKDEASEKEVSNTPKTIAHQQQPQQRQPLPQGVLWTTKANAAATPPPKPLPKALGEDEQYQNFIAGVS